MDSTFGPRLLGHFDFTLLFEHTIFEIVPSSILIFSLPFYVHKILTGQRLVRPGWLLWAKATVTIGMAAVQLASVVFWFRSPLHSRLAEAAAIFYFLGSIGVIIITYASHAYFLQPVLFLASYLNITLLLDLVTIYSYYHRTGLDTIARLTCSLPVLKFILLALEETSKRSLVIAENRDQISREITAGFWNRATFFWVNPLLLFGFRHVIHDNNLPSIGEQFDSKYLYQKLKATWEKQDQTSKYALLRALVFSMPWPFLFVILPRLFLVGFIFGQPFLLQDVVNYSSNEVTQPDHISKEQEATSLIMAAALIFCGKAISKAWFSHIKNQIMVCIRGALASAVYDKSLRLGIAEAEDSATVTLITTDIPSLEAAILLLYDIVAMILEVAFGTAILTVFVGAASAIAIICTIKELQDPRRNRPTSPQSSLHPHSGSTQPQAHLIHLSGVNVTMDLTGTILRNASIIIRPGKVTMIDGTVGCGKTTLLNVMLGEMPLRNGTVTLSTRSIAFAGQKPWLLNTTIRLNIIGHKAYDEPLYTEIITICQLRVDFEQLPNGDETVSIARALYVEATVTILDDPFSSLDHETSSAIRLRLLEEGRYATQGGRSLVMTTSMKQHLDSADTTYRVQANGFIVPLTREQVNTELNELVRNRPAGVVSSAGSGADSVASSEPPVVVPATTDEVDNEREVASQKYSSISIYKYFLQPAGIVAVVIWLVLNGVASASERMPILNVANAASDINLATQRIPGLILPTIWRAYSILIDIAIISSGASYAAPIIPFFSLLIVTIQQFYLSTSRQLRALELDTTKMLVRHLIETATGITHIRAFRWQEEVRNDFFAMLNIAQRPFYLLYCVQQWLECALDLSTAGAAILVVTFAVKFSNTASANSMGLAFLSLIGFSNTVGEWVISSVAMETAFGAVARIRAYSETVPKEKYKDDKGPVSTDWPPEGVLELNCVSAVYGNQDPTQASQIDNLTVTIKPGLGGLGITGRTGRVGLWDIISARGGLTARMKDMRFSGGQRQLFQFARAMLHHQTMGTKILLMDEATSSLDEETEAQILPILKTAFAGCTKMVISHRRAVLDSTDYVKRLFAPDQSARFAN
ncbi:hypothetical protein PWT90_07627 [Aphanocladium album]|nr:hypothetical protein PWT90_07627 [Aphanocladium album]